MAMEFCPRRNLGRESSNLAFLTKTRPQWSMRYGPCIFNIYFDVCVVDDRIASQCFGEIDKDGSGSLSIQELIAWVDSD